MEEQAPTRSLICSPFTEKSSSKVSLPNARFVKGPFSALEPSLVYFNIFDLKTQLEDNIPNFVLFLRSHGHLSFSGQRLSICETAGDSGAHPCRASSSGFLSPLRLLSPHAPDLCFPQTEPLHVPDPTF